MKRGCRLTILGLTKRTDLNGQNVIYMHKNKHRRCVSVVFTGEQVCVMPHNVEFTQTFDLLDMDCIEYLLVQHPSVLNNMLCVNNVWRLAAEASLKHLVRQATFAKDSTMKHRQLFHPVLQCPAFQRAIIHTLGAHVDLSDFERGLLSVVESFKLEHIGISLAPLQFLMADFLDHRFHEFLQGFHKLLRDSKLWTCVKDIVTTSFDYVRHLPTPIHGVEFGCVHMELINWPFHLPILQKSASLKTLFENELKPETVSLFHFETGREYEVLRSTVNLRLPNILAFRLVRWYHDDGSLKFNNCHVRIPRILSLRDSICEHSYELCFIYIPNTHPQSSYFSAPGTCLWWNATNMTRLRPCEIGPMKLKAAKHSEYIVYARVGEWYSL